MKIVIEPADFRRLSPSAQKELLALLTESPAPAARGTGAGEQLSWSKPYELSEGQAEELVRGLSPRQHRLLSLFANRTGRVRMKELMLASGDNDLRAASTFQKAMTRRLRRLIGDQENKVQLIQWDFDATRWDSGKTTIVDGVYYVSPATAHALRLALKSGHRGGGRH